MLMLMLMKLLDRFNKPSEQPPTQGFRISNSPTHPPRICIGSAEVPRDWLQEGHLEELAARLQQQDAGRLDGWNAIGEGEEGADLLWRLVRQSWNFLEPDSASAHRHWGRGFYSKDSTNRQHEHWRLHPEPPSASADGHPCQVCEVLTLFVDVGPTPVSGIITYRGKIDQRIRPKNSIWPWRDWYWCGCWHNPTQSRQPGRTYIYVWVEKVSQFLEGPHNFALLFSKNANTPYW